MSGVGECGRATRRRALVQRRSNARVENDIVCKCLTVELSRLRAVVARLTMGVEGERAGWQSCARRLARSRLGGARVRLPDSPCSGCPRQTRAASNERADTARRAAPLRGQSLTATMAAAMEAKTNLNVRDALRCACRSLPAPAASAAELTAVSSPRPSIPAHSYLDRVKMTFADQTEGESGLGVLPSEIRALTDLCRASLRPLPHVRALTLSGRLSPTSAIGSC